MDNREIIINRAHKLLMEIGPTSMTMDMVARACGISKRTLYETFPDKKTLILECVATEHAQHDLEAQKIFREASNCFEALFKVFKNTRQHLEKRSQAFLDDMQRLYPEAIARNHDNEKQFISHMSLVFQRAQDEGLVIADINNSIAAFIFLNQLKSLHKNPSIEVLGFNKVTVYEAAFINFLRGIATIKGIEYIDSHINTLRTNKNN